MIVIRIVAQQDWTHDLLPLGHRANLLGSLCIRWFTLVRFQLEPLLIQTIGQLFRLCPIYWRQLVLLYHSWAVIREPGDDFWALSGLQAKILEFQQHSPLQLILHPLLVPRPAKVLQPLAIRHQQVTLTPLQTWPHPPIFLQSYDYFSENWCMVNECFRPF